MKEIPENVRYNINVYNGYYLRLLIYKMHNIFKCSFEEAIKSVSQKVNVFGRKWFVKKSCEFFEIEFKDSIYDKSLKFRPLIRTLKILPTPEHIIKKCQEKRMQTHFEKYGCKTPFGLKSTQDNVKKTFNKKYGGNTPMKSKEVKEKVKNTTLDRYGVTNCMNIDSEILKNIKKPKKEYKQRKTTKKPKEYSDGISHWFYTPEYKKKFQENKENMIQKAKQTCLEKYGVDNYTKTDEFKMFWQDKKDEILEKRAQTNLLLYGAEHYQQSLHFKQNIDTYTNKIKQTMLNNYGVENFCQSETYREKLPEIISKKEETNLKKYGVKNYPQSMESKPNKFNITKEEYNRRLNEEYNNECFIRNNFIKDNKFLKEEFMSYFFISSSHVSKIKHKFNIIEPNRDTIEEVFIKDLENVFNISLIRQFYIKDLKVRIDAFDENNDICYEFLGDYYHGNPETTNEYDINFKNKKTMLELYIETFNRFDKIKSSGYNIIYIWESDYKNYGLNSLIMY